MIQPSQLDVYLPWELLSPDEQTLFALEFDDLEAWELQHSLYQRRPGEYATTLKATEVQ